MNKDIVNENSNDSDNEVNISKNYKMNLGQKLGKGSFGEIYKGK